jgi:hypothetical protein
MMMMMVWMKLGATWRDPFLLFMMSALTMVLPSKLPRSLAFNRLYEYSVDDGFHLVIGLRTILMVNLGYGCGWDMFDNPTLR